MIDFVDAKSSQTHPGPVRKGIETGAEQYVLPHSSLIGLGQRVLREPAADGNESSEKVGGICVPIAARAQFLLGLSSNDGQSQRIGEDLGVIQELMGGAMQGRPLRCSAR